MADYSPDFTARIKVRYTAGTATHTQTWRIPGPPENVDILSALAVIQAFYDALTPILWEDAAVLSTLVAAKDSSVFLPTSTALTMTGSTALATATGSVKSAAASFVGRTLEGLRVIVYQYGIAMMPDEIDNFRFNPGEQAEIDAAIAELQDAGAVLVGNDGNQAHWYSYANFKSNDYWVGQVRG